MVNHYLSIADFIFRKSQGHDELTCLGFFFKVYFKAVKSVFSFYKLIFKLNLSEISKILWEMVEALNKYMDFPR